LPSSTPLVPPNPAPATPPQRSASGRLAPILVGVVAVLLVGGGIAAWMVMGRTPSQDTTTPTSANTSQTTTVAATAPPPDTGTAVPAPPPTDTAPTAPATVDAKITCSPACGEILVDDQKVEDMTKPIALTPGSHKVSVSKSGYVAQSESITVEAGKPFSKEFKLVAEKQDKPPVASTTPTKPPTGGGTPTGGGGTPVRKCGKLIKTNCK
jgi:hypothetical protein